MRRLRDAVALAATLATLPGLVDPASAQASLPSAEDYHLRLEYLWGSPYPDGQLQKGLGEDPGTLLDVRLDLGVEENAANVLRGALRLGQSWKLRGSWMPLDFGGDTEARQPFTYGTLEARVGDRIVSSLKGNLFGGDVEWDFVRRPGGFLGVLFGVRYFDVDTLVVNATLIDRVAETQRLPIPVVGLASRTYFSRFSAEAEIAGMTAGSRGHLLELLFAVRFHVSDHLAATGGYRRLTIEGQDERDFLELKLGTWTFGAEISL
jgi:hypothetical protein